MQRMFKSTSLPREHFQRVALFVCLGITVYGAIGTTLLTHPTTAASCDDVYDPVPSWLRDRINDNKTVYQQVASETGVPWQVMAGIHYREFNAAVSNPSNGQGIYQLYSIYYSDDKELRDEYRALAKPGITVTRTNFIKQSRLAANFLQDKAANPYTATTIVTPRKMTSSEKNISLIKNALFSYNGRASAYADQATKYGYNKNSHPFEGSPYVMSKFDCKRANMGLITSDGGSTLTATDTRMGAFTLYARLKGDAYWKSLQSGTNYKTLDQPRWMEVVRDTRKVSTLTGDPSGDVIEAGREIYFPDKISFNGGTYLRTAYDHDAESYQGIPLTDLKEIVPVYTSVTTPRWMQLNATTARTDPVLRKATGDPIAAGTPVYISSQTTVGGITYLRTKSDTQANYSRGFLVSKLEELTPNYTNFSAPIPMNLTASTYKISLPTGENYGSSITKGTKINFSSSLTLGGVTYWRATTDHENGNHYIVPLAALKDVLSYQPLDPRPTTLRAIVNTKKISLDGTYQQGPTIWEDQNVEFYDRILYRNKWYVRTKYDALRGNHTGVSEYNMRPPAETLEYISLDKPRYLAPERTLKKTSLLTGGSYGIYITSGTKIRFTTKVFYKGEWYLRTSYDTERSSHLGIPLSDLREV